MDMFEEYDKQIREAIGDVQKKFNKQFPTQELRFVQYIHKSICNKGPCELCSYNDFRLFEDNNNKPLVGENNHWLCDCYYKKVDTLYSDDLVAYALDVVVRSLQFENKLPNYYISKEEAINEYGWNKRRNTIAGKAPGKMIGGDIYTNKDDILPVKAGRVWRECDIGYQFGGRNKLRLFYSNDGLMFFSPDHGEREFFYIKGV